MEKEILKEICSDLKRKDRVIVKLFKRTFIKVYNNTRAIIFNKMID